MSTFNELGLSQPLIRAVSNMGFEETTPIQEQTIPVVLEGRDIIGQAQTGTGKTAAFGIPLVEKLDVQSGNIGGLVVTPTRELAVQVAEELNKIGQFKGVRALPIYGGQDINRQIRALKNRPHIIVGTPGRLMDHMRRKTIRLQQVAMVILDEADEMLNMGFIDDIRTILEEIPEERQTLLFSATMPKPIHDLAQRFMRNPELISIKTKEVTVPNTEQNYVEVQEKQKFDVLCRLLDIQSPELAIIFGRTKRRVDELYEALNKRGYSAEGIHGDLTQAKRDSVLRKFKEGVTEILVATDVAARGLDISGVTHVYNYDIPQDPESYVHRIAHASHHNTGDKWCIYPMYDYAHPLEDAVEGVTHSICTLEFEDHRPLYDWVIKECETECQPQQYEFARLNMTNTVMSKRWLKRLVDEKIVDGWDDPRMPTVSGLRRRGYTPEAIRNFVREIGVAKSNSIVDTQMLDHFVREDLKLKAPRTMAVIRPLKVVITNYPEGQVEWLDAEVNPENLEMGMRQIPFSREIYVEQDDFMEDPPKKYFRLFPGNEVRLKHAYFIICNEVIKDGAGNVVELRCTYDQVTKSGTDFTERKVKGTIHWVEATQAVPAEFRLYEPLILDEDREEGENFLDNVNPKSLEILQGFIEPNMGEAKPQDKFQFFRHGYFNVDPKSSGDKLVFHRTVSLKSSFKLE